MLKWAVAAIGLVASMMGDGGLRSACAGQALPAKPVVYNLIAGPGDLGRQVFHQIYDPAFQVVDLSKSEAAYVLPRLKEGPPPTVAVEEDIEIEEETEVMVLFVVTVEGRVAHPVILWSSDLHLTVAVLDALCRWVFEPARVNGEKVSATAGQRFVFFPWNLATL
jgi:hypothetical protein